VETRCPSCASESLKLLGVQPGRVVTPTKSRQSANPLSVNVACKDCGHVWYHEIEHVDMTEGEAEDTGELALAYEDYWPW
jgi:uncharacterized Zn finger protein